MTCPTCGSANPLGAKFCNECATRLNVTCPSCGASNPPTAKFCSECATNLNATGIDSPAVAAIGQTSGASAPETGRPAGGPVAERRLVSVLFADLVGFTPFAEERDPEAVRDTLSAYYEHARAAVERHGGVIEKFIGDAVMAVWGTPVAHEDDAERAVRAALEIVDDARQLGAGIEARAGVLTGEAAVNLGAVGQGMVAGDLVNAAARLQSAAAPSTVLVGEATRRASEAAIAYDEHGTLEVKGRTAPLDAWQARRVLAQRGGHGRTEAIEPPFVGRDDEFRLLRDALHATGRDRRIRLVSITGPAGIGKSRLAWELEKYIDGVVEPIYWHRGRSPSYGDGVAFWALGEMVRRRAGLAEADDEATTRERIAATLAEYVADPEDRAWVERAVLALLGLEPPPPGGRDALFAGWRLFFEHIARKGSTVLLFEDLQWADPGLLDFIDHLLEWSKAAPILVVTLARPELLERRSTWGPGARHVTSMALEPLGDAAMRELLAGLVPGLGDEFVRAILGRADGVPLYAVETVRALVADGRLERDGDSYRPTGDLSRLTVPDSLRSLIGSRLDALDAVDRRLIADAAILGRTFSPAALAEISGTTPAELEPHLRNLVRREILELEADPRSPERGQYGFVQSLIREVAYETISRRDRRARHLAAARYFESLDDPEIAGALASHYLSAHAASDPGPEAAALAGQARLALRAAADRAAALGGHAQAVRHLVDALAVTEMPGERAELLERAATSADAGTEYETAERYAADAADAYRQAGDLLGVARATGLLGWIVINAADVARASTILQGALDSLPESARGTETEAILLVHLSRAAMRRGEALRSIEVADRALPIAEHKNLDELVAEALVNKASSLDFLGRPREAIALYDAAIEIARERGLIGTELRAINNSAGARTGSSPRDSLALVRAGIELAAKVGNRGMGAWLIGSNGYWSYWAGDGWDEAERRIEDELVLNHSAGDRLRLLGVLSQFQSARGRWERADAEVLRDLATGLSDPQLLSGNEYSIAEDCQSVGDWQEALRAARLCLEALPDYASLALPLAIRSALVIEDIETVRGSVAALDAFPSGDRSIRAYRAYGHAVLAGLEGRSAEAMTGLEAVRRTFREMGLRLDLARTGIDLVRLAGPADPVARRAAEEARTIFEDLRATAWLDRLDEAIAAGPPAGPVPAGAAVP